MSKTIKITIVIKKEQSSLEYELEGHQKTINEIKITHDIEKTVMSTLLNEELVSVDNCGGRGVCGKCRIRFLNYAPIPTGFDRNAFAPEELRQGYRLACMAKPQNDCTISLEFVKGREIDIVTDVSSSIGSPDNNNERKVSEINKTSDSVHVQDFIDPKSQQIVPTKNKSNYKSKHIIAVDLGTTTIAMQLMELNTGKIIDTYCAMNPQRVYGADVLSRIQAAGMGHADSMKNSVWKVISDGVNTFLNNNSPNNRHQECKYQEDQHQNKHLTISCMCIAGNTTMEHLLMGLPTEGLGRSPFTPAEVGLQECIMPGYDFPVYITSVISTFVGGDIVAGLYHCNLLTALTSKQNAENITCTDDTFTSYNKTDARLFIDLGTNGEMAIIAGERIIVTATAAGPAFEGGASAAAPGSDMIKIIASLLEKGIVDETGLLISPYFDEGIDISIPNQTMPIHLTQKDIRAIQMAKAAIRAGIDILCQKMQGCNLTQVYLAGGFGYYLDVDSAIAIGLLPETLRGRIQAVGNTSLAGAFDIAQAILTNAVNIDALTNSLNEIESLNLAQEDSFESLYINYLNFPNIKNT